jgi:hypothetical protein
MDYVVMNTGEGFRGAKRGETITFETVDEVNEAIAEGAQLALPHSVGEAPAYAPHEDPDYGDPHVADVSEELDNVVPDVGEDPDYDVE